MGFETKKGMAKAVDGVSFDVHRGEVYGLAGESGSGKSTIALAVLRLIEEPGKILSGKILYDGQNVLDFDDNQLRAYRWSKVSMVFQGAMNSFNPVMRIGEQLVDAITAHSNMSLEDAQKRAQELLEMVGIDKIFINRYPFELSGGMKQRAMIAMALILNPPLLIADEPTTSIDVIRQVEILKLLKSLQSKFGLSMIYITHDLSLMAAIADRIGILYAGKLVEEGPVDEIYERPAHPYTKLLLQSIPKLEGESSIIGIPGQPPNPLSYPSGCRFHPRCPFAMNICVDEEPLLKEVSGEPPAEISGDRQDYGVGPSHRVACFLWDKAGAGAYDTRFTPVKKIDQKVG